MADEKTERNVTIFGPESKFRGNLSFTDDLVITGSFDGTINATGNLTVEKTGVCTVDSIHVQSAVIFGTVNGNIIASDRVEMCSGSRVAGDVTSARLRIANDVEFEGQVTMTDKIPETDLFATASDEFRKAFVLRSDSID